MAPARPALPPQLRLHLQLLSSLTTYMLALSVMSLHEDGTVGRSLIQREPCGVRGCGTHGVDCSPRWAQSGVVGHGMPTHRPDLPACLPASHVPAAAYLSLHLAATCIVPMLMAAANDLAARRAFVSRLARLTPEAGPSPTNAFPPPRLDGLKAHAL